MSIEEIRAALDEARREQDQARRELIQAQEALRKVERERAELRRRAGDEQDGTLERLRKREEALSAQLEDARGRLGVAVAGETRWLDLFDPFSDPRDGIGELDDSLPILMFPLRIETRFKKIGRRDELWVRVYPDECLVDGFQQSLSEAEVEGALRYWTAWWAAGGVEDQRRAAWRGLVTRFGSGRASYIVKSYVPANAEDAPLKDAPGDLVLVVVTDQAPPPAEQGALAAYWETVYRAPDDVVAQGAAADQLRAAVGAARAAELTARYVPANLTEEPVAPAKRADVPIDLVYLLTRPASEVPTTVQSWTEAARVDLLPDRLVLLAYVGDEEVVNQLGNMIPHPLIVGPDPLADPAVAMHAEGDELELGPDMAWMVNFDKAVDAGMGFVVPLTPEQARRGFDRLLVAGVRTSLDAEATAGRVEELLEHHGYSRKGFSLLPQGTPTNNTEDGDSAFARFDDPDASYDDLFGTAPDFVPTTDWVAKPDGQWVAEWLGLDPAVFHKVRFARGADQGDARAMNRALWPATWGYFLESMMSPLLDDDTIEKTRAFFNDYVLGRGAVPALRVGRQPYGILPTTALSRVDWFQTDRPRVEAARFDGEVPFLSRLHALLSRVEADWSAMSGDVSFVGKTGGTLTPQQLLLDIVGLNPASVEFHQRYAETFAHLTNQLKLQGLGNFFTALVVAAFVKSGEDLLRSLGHTGEERPDILEKFFLDQNNTLVGHLVDDQPLSETAPVRAYTDDDRNYLQWLRDAALTSHDALRLQAGFTDGKRPTALLYLLLHHALDLSFFETSLKLHLRADVLSSADVQEMRREPPFIHVAEAAQRTESRWGLLYTSDTRVTGGVEVSVGEYIPQVVGIAAEAGYLDEQLRAIEHLQGATTARLERALVEHLDTCSYRLDAWRAGLIHYQLAQLRFGGSREGAARRGVYTGAFGWLEDVRSEDKRLGPASIPGDLQPVFQPEGSPPLEVDPANAGYVHAPSLDHAVTAAVLRNGYLANATPSEPDLLSVNLSSRRVREAHAVVEGIRAGQSLSALLGYRLERHLHDASPAVEVDELVYKLRKAFPLVADHLTDTASPATQEIEAVEARNVVDGLALVEHVKATGLKTYPYGKDLPATATAPQRDVLDAGVKELLDVEDAVADIAVAESVHQVVRGNFTRAAATLDTYSKGSFPPTPEVVQTPRTGTTLTHRFGLQLDAGADPGATVNGVPPTPRSRVEPAVNEWLAGLLPLPTRVGCRVRFVDVDGADRAPRISQADLALQPVDLMYLLDPRQEPALTALDDMVLDHVYRLPKPPRPDARVEITYREFKTGDVSFFELSPLLASLREVVLRSRPLRPSDVRLAHETDAAAVEDVTIDPARLTAPTNALTAGRDELADFFLPALDALLADSVANEQALVDGIDQLIRDWAAVGTAVDRCAASPSGLGASYAARGSIYSAIVEKILTLVGEWDERLGEHDDLLVAAAAAPTEEAAVSLLEEAERKISTKTTIPRPPTTAAYLPLLGTKRNAFADKRDLLEGAVDGSASTLAQLVAAVEAELPVDAFDAAGLDLAPERGRVVALAQDLQRQARALHDDLTRRLDTSVAKIAEGGVAVRPDDVLDAHTEAARALLGEDFAILPRFRLAPDQAAEWTNAYQGRAALLDHLNEERDFAVEDWLHGVARVREKLWHWENAVLMSDVLRGATADLDPIQLPFRQPDYWLGLEYPDEVLGTDDPFVVDEEKLLYTAHYAGGFDAGGELCGVLVDEWTETLPTTTEDTGLTFHYDRPSSEPPQALLLAVSPRSTGRWQWKDLVDTLLETLAMAKGRAREPRQIERTAYARFLPATVAAVTVRPLTIALNYALANNIASELAGGPDGGD